MFAVIVALVLAAASVVSSVCVLLYLRKAVVKEHEHIKKLFGTMCLLKDHLQHQAEEAEQRILAQIAAAAIRAVAANFASEIERARVALAKELTEHRKLVAEQLTVIQLKANAQVEKSTRPLHDAVAGVTNALKNFFSKRNAAPATGATAVPPP